MVKSIRAVIVGIDDYDDPRFLTKKLNFAAVDALAIARAFNNSNVLTIEKLELHTNKTANHQRIWQSLNDVFKSNLTFDSDTIAIFYFAGHGLRDPLDDSRVYLCCSDVEMANPMRGGIPLNTIHNLLLKSSAGCSIAIIDACFSGAISDARRIEQQSPVELARQTIGALKGADDKTIAIFASCRADQLSREDSERQHGIYTDEFLQGWRDGKACDAQGRVDLFGLAAYLSRRFEEDDQSPRSNVLSGRSIVLWQHPVPETTIIPPEPLVLPKRLLVVGERISIPIQPTVEPKTVKQRIKQFAIPIAVAMVALLACSLSAIFIEQLHVILLGLVFTIFIAFIGITMTINRGAGVVALIIHIPLLAGFGYQYFHWGGGIAAVVTVLAFLASFIWLFWVIFAVETLLFAGLILLTMMS